MAATKAAKYTKELAEHFYETMCTIRKFEESVKHDFLNGEIPGFVHLYIGEEAIATGVCSALRKDDMIESTHRGHSRTRELLIRSIPKALAVTDFVCSSINLGSTKTGINMDTAFATPVPFAYVTSEDLL